MNTKTNFFATRTAARAAVAELNGKFQDFGTDAPKGERWAVVVEVQEQEHDMNAQIALLQASVQKDEPKAVLTIARKPRGSMLSTKVQNLKGKSVPVYQKPNRPQLAA